MAKASLQEALWRGKIARVSNGWLITFFNRGAMPGTLLFQKVEFKVPFGKTALVNGASIEFVSEPLANPGGEVLLLLKVKEESLLELVGSSLILQVGKTNGPLYDQISITLN